VLFWIGLLWHLLLSASCGAPVYSHCLAVAISCILHTFEQNAGWETCGSEGHRCQIVWSGIYEWTMP